MNRSRMLTSLVGLVFVLTLVSSVRADSIHQPPGLDKFNFGDIQALGLPDIDRENVSDFLSEHFANNNGNHFGFVNSLDALTAATGTTGNNGKQLGFSVSSFHGGMKFGLANPRHTNATVSQNPEPTAMLLLGTGLAAVGAFARRARKRKRTEQR